MNKKLKRYIIVLLICVIIIPYAYLKKTTKDDGSEKNTIPVTTKPIAEITEQIIKNIPANVISKSSSSLSAEINGNIIDILVDIGEKVHTGEIIAKIDCTEYQYKYDSFMANKLAIKADLDLSKWQYENNKKLAVKNNVSKEVLNQFRAKVDKLNAQLKMTEANLENAKNNIAKCEIKAPFAGVIAKRWVNLGEYVVPGTKIADMIDNDNLEIEAKVYEDEIASLKQQTNIIYVSNNKQYPVELKTIVPRKDEVSKSQIARFTFTSIKPVAGDSGRLIWEDSNNAIPAKYIRKFNNELGIFILKDNKAKFMRLNNAIEGQAANIANQIEEPVIIDGRFRVKDESKVVVQES